jgi:hypothetical protein
MCNSSDNLPSTITGSSLSKKPKRTKDKKNNQMLASAIQSFADKKSDAKVFQVRVNCMLKNNARCEKEEMRGKRMINKGTTMRSAKTTMTGTEIGKKD